MALPPIAQARIITPPDVFQYAMREGPQLAQAFTAGLAAGSRMREGKQAAKDRDTARADRVTERNQAAMERFGADAVIEPESGMVDVTRSAEAFQNRQRMAKLALEAGQAEAAGVSLADIPDEVRQMPEYRTGLAQGMATVRGQEAMLERAAAQQEAMLGRQRDIEMLRQKGATALEGVRQAGRVARDLIAPRRESSGTPPITVTLDENGQPTVRRQFANEDDFQKWKATEDARRAEAAKLAELDPIAEAVRKYDELTAAGKGADLEFKEGVPVVTPSTWFHSATPEAMNALRARLNPQPAQRSGPRPVPVPELDPNVGAPSLPPVSREDVAALMGQWPSIPPSRPEVSRRPPQEVLDALQLWPDTRPSLQDAIRYNRKPESKKPKELTPEQEEAVYRILNAREIYGGPVPEETLGEALGFGPPERVQFKKVNLGPFSGR